MTYIQADAANVKAAIHDLMTAFPDLAEDGDLRADMLEGETDLHKIVERCLNERQEADTMANAIKEREGDLRARRTRFERKADAMKRLMKDLMEYADLPKLALPEATLSLRDPMPSVNVINVDDLPQGYFKLTKTADKNAIKEHIMAGEKIPGAELVLGESGLTIRTK